MLGSPETRLEPVIIKPAPRWARLGLGELWEFRGLFYFLAWRDLKVRYKQTAVGAGWAVLQPFLVMIVFTIFFNRVAKIGSDGVPYPIFSYSGLIPWLFFSNSLAFSANSVVASSSLITKVYFPRLLVAIAPVISYLVDMMLAFSILIVLMVYYRVYPHPGRVLIVVPLTLFALVTAIGVGLWLAALNVRYRDVRFIVPFLVQLWMFATPVVYPASAIGGVWRTLFGLNPMVGVVEGFRWALIGTGAPRLGTMLLSLLATGVLALSGAYYFRRVERVFADVV